MQIHRFLPQWLMTLRGRLTLLFGSFTLLILFGVGIYVGRIATNELRNVAGETLYVSARSAAELLAANLRERELEIDLLRRAPLFTHGDLAGTDMREALQVRKQAHSEYVWIGVAAPDGTILQATDGLLVGVNAAQRDWFQAARRQPYSGDRHEALLLASKLQRADSDQPLYLLDFAAPILDAKGQLRGVLGAHAHWSWVTDTVESVMRTRLGERQGEVLIADREGRIVYPQRYMGELVLPSGYPSDAHFALLRWDGLDYLTSIARVGTTTGADFGWRIVVRQPEAHALAASHALRKQLLLLGTLAAAVFAFVTYHFARRISRPIEALAQTLSQIEAGQRRPEFPQGPLVYEVERLSRSAQSMTLALLAHEAHLSSLVDERTEALRQANEALARLAATDALTGVNNRRMFDERLQEFFRLSQRHGPGYALLLIDADFFKRVNDTYGHPVGDAVLQTVASLIRDNTRETDFVARYGGEEFAVLLPMPGSADEAAIVAEKIRAAVAEHLFPTVGRMSVSIGLSYSLAGDDTPRLVVARADAALYQAKEAGRNRVVAA